MSTLELMLQQLQQSTEHNVYDLPPALPVRPVSKARLPPGKKSWPVKLQDIDIRKKDALVSPINGFESSEKINVEEANGECGGFGDSGCSLIQKIGILDYTREREEQVIVGTQTHFEEYCHQELIRGIIALQSFVRAENARNRKSIATRTLQARHRAVLILQSVARGWLSRRQVRYTKNSERRRLESKGYVHVSYRDVFELQRRVLKTEAAVQYKKDENDSLQMKIAQYEKQWLQHEAKMKSMEKMWQEQLTYIQVSLAEVSSKAQAAEENENQITTMDSASMRSDANGEGLLYLGELDSDANSEDELRKLKLRFETWTKHYKSQLHKTKATLQKLETSKVKKSSKKWWER